MTTDIRRDGPPTRTDEAAARRERTQTRPEVQVPRHLRRFLALADFERAAMRHLPRPLAGFISGGSETDALVRANRDFDLLIVPNAGHTVLFTSGYAQRRAWDYFVCHLLGETPPQNFEVTFEPHEADRFAKQF